MPLQGFLPFVLLPDTVADLTTVFHRLSNFFVYFHPTMLKKVRVFGIFFESFSDEYGTEGLVV